MSEITRDQERALLADKLSDTASGGELQPNILTIAAQKLRKTDEDAFADRLIERWGILKAPRFTNL